MKNLVDIGIIGALGEEVSALIEKLEERTEESVSGIAFHTGKLFGKRVAIAKCGVGKVFAALCAEAMIIKYAPKLIVNTGVGGALKKGISVCDILVADKLVQHDMDTSPLGDPKGLISGINVIYFKTDNRAVEIIKKAAVDISVTCHTGTIASGDVFVSTEEQKKRILNEFSASVCEMEGAAIAQVAYVNATPCCVIRAISDSADEGSSMDYMKFLPIAARNSTALTLELCRNW
ncbi:MAG: 5'-methylthioadenosine/adenosylhomocysteine nucleosidase [Clostridia bacterium]|nr:5'-methylthioadenosine/adenosylhomocysteine nucleosidase [Clostridia bacterium]